MIEKTSLKKNTRQLDFRPLIAFFVTLVASLLMFANVGVTPFGNHNILTSDLAAQYGPYLIGIRNALESGESILYTQALGMGRGTLGLIAYYLSSPLNIIVLLFPKNNIQEAITIMICIKLAFAGSFMTWLLDRKFKTQTKMTIVFGLMYPLCSFVLSFIFNIMWLDGIALLPLLIMLVEKFIENRRCWPKLTLILLLLFVSGYYMAYMIGIFSFLYLLCVMGYQGKFSGEETKQHAKTVGWFILSAVVAALISATLLLPAGLDTIRNGDFTEAEALTMDPEFSLISLIDQFLANGAPILSENLPFIFCGLSALFLFLLFFFNKTIEKKLKLSIAGVSLAFLLSFQLPLLNRFWHLFDEPNWFHFRYSYLFSFVMILVAFYSFLHIKEAGKKSFLMAYGIIIALCVISQSVGEMSKAGNIYFATLMFLTLEVVLFYGLTLDDWPAQISNLKRFGAGFLVVTLLVEVVLFNTQRYLPNVIGKVTNANLYPTMLDEMDELASNIDRSTWSRTEIEYTWNEFIQSNTLPNYINTKSIASFASMSNKKTNHFLKQLGYEANYNYFSLDHANTIDPADAMLGIRYIMTTGNHLNELNKVASVNRTEVKQDSAEKSIYLYENPYALPLAYLVEPDAGGFDAYALEKDVHEKDYFSFQEQWIESLSGLDASDIYETFQSEWEVMNGERTDVPPLEDQKIAIDVNNSLNQEVSPWESEDLIIYYRNSDKSAMVLRTEITITDQTPLYLVIPFPMLQYKIKIYVNDELITEHGYSYYSRIVALGNYEIGEKINVDLRVESPAMVCFEPIFAYCHLENMKPHYEKLSSTVNEITVENGHVTMTVSSDTEKLLFTTIPYEDGWEAWVDGQKTEPIAYQDALLSIPLTAGTHTVALKFTPPGWKAGIACSCAGVLFFVVLSFVVTRRKQTIVAEKKEENTTVNIKNTTTNEEEKT